MKSLDWKERMGVIENTKKISTNQGESKRKKETGVNLADLSSLKIFLVWSNYFSFKLNYYEIDIFHSKMQAFSYIR